MQKGIIIRGIGGFYYVLSDGNVYECKARGVFRKEKITPMVGDNVCIEVKNGKGSITEIMPRKNSLVRPPVANIDTLCLVIAAAAPEPNLRLIDKMLVYAEKSSINAVICINKTDLGSRDDIVEIYEKAGYPVICVSAGTKTNMEALHKIMDGKVTAFAGLSGVGKSSLLNILTDAGMETGNLSQKIERGKHTTRHVELIKANNGFVFDTPGFSSLEVPDMSEDELETCFPDISRFSDGSKFRGCSHIKDSGCAVRQAVADGKIALSRYESYSEMRENLRKRKIY